MGGIPLLENAEIRISNPSSLNDPFELMPRMEEMTPEQLAYRLEHDSEFREHLKKILLDRGSISNESGFEEYLKNNKINFIKNFFSDEMTLASLSDHHYFQKETEEFFGITSFSLVPDNILMWSHYADKHKGFMVEFCFDETEAIYDCLTLVIYSNLRAEFDNLEDTAVRHKQLMKTMRTKSLDWAYEKEVRAIMPWQICKKKEDGSYYYSFAPKCIESVTIGVKCPVKVKAKIMQIMGDKYPHAKINEAVVNRDNYSLDFVQYNKTEK